MEEPLEDLVAVPKDQDELTSAGWGKRRPFALTLGGPQRILRLTSLI